MNDAQLALAVTLDDHARFDTFLAGPNEQAIDHLRAVLKNRARNPASWLRGPSGSGKSHLLQAACAAGAEAGLATSYVPLGSFQGLEPALLENRAGAALLCLDDVDAIAGHPAWERAVFNAFNEVAAAGGALVVAATGSPRETEFALADLASRLSWGPTYRLLPLSDEQRVSALQLRARHRGLDLPDEVGEWLLKRVLRDMNSLYRLLDQLDTASLAAGRRLTIPFVKEILARSDESA